MLDSFLDKVPTGSERLTAYALDFSGTNIRAVRAKLEGNGRITTAEHRINLRDEPAPFTKGLLDKQCGAKELFDSLARSIREVMERSGDLARSKDTPLGFCVSFPCELRSIKSGALLEWTKVNIGNWNFILQGFETGRATADPVEGLDIATLLDMACWRHKFGARVTAVTNDTIAMLLSCAYEKPAHLPPCTVSFMIGVGLNGAYVEPDAKSYKYQGTIINTEIGGFDKGLPVTDVDLEVDFADEGGNGRQIFEKMIAGGYLGEVCRRLVVKLWQSEAPALAWSRQALPTAVAALCVSDLTDNLDMIERLLRGLWEWQTTLSERRTIQKMFILVFDRSAGLAAAAIAALARKSGRLQPAMGGVTVALDSSLHISHRWYSENVRLHHVRDLNRIQVRNYLNQLLGEQTASFVNLYVCNDGTCKGAAILAAITA